MPDVIFSVISFLLPIRSIYLLENHGYSQKQLWQVGIDSEHAWLCHGLCAVFFPRQYALHIARSLRLAPGHVGIGHCRQLLFILTKLFVKGR